MVIGRIMIEMPLQKEHIMLDCVESTHFLGLHANDEAEWNLHPWWGDEPLQLPRQSSSSQGFSLVRSTEHGARSSPWTLDTHPHSPSKGLSAGDYYLPESTFAQLVSLSTSTEKPQASLTPHFHQQHTHCKVRVLLLLLLLLLLQPLC